MTSLATATEAAPTPAPTVVVPLRHYGRWAVGAVVLVLFGMLLASLYANRNVDHGTVATFLTQAHVLDGLRNTVILTVLCQAVGIALGVGVAVMRLSANPVLRAVGWAYVWFFRGTPLLVQIILWFNFALLFQHLVLGIPYTHLSLAQVTSNEVFTAFGAAAVALSINEGAYMAEIVRAGISAVDEGQTEAAQALGMTRMQVLRRIVLPQAARVIVPPTGNELQNMIKNTSLVAVIGGHDLLTSVQDIYANNLAVIDLLVVACFWYLVLSSIAMVGQFYLERRFATGSVRTLPLTPFQRLRLVATGNRRSRG